MQPEESLPYAQDWSLWRQLAPASSLHPMFSRAHGNITLPATPSGLFPLGFQTEMLYTFSHACYMPRPFHPP